MSSPLPSSASPSPSQQIPSIAPTAQVPPDYPGFKVLLEGGPGSGKTYCTASLADLGLKVRYLMTENSKDSVTKFFTDKGRSLPPNVSWVYIPMTQMPLNELVQMSRQINVLSFDSLSKMSDPARQKHDELVKILNSLVKFVDERTGADLGSADSWGNDSVLVIDSLTGLNSAAMALVVGGRPTRGQADWQVAQNNLENIIRRLTQIRAHVVLTAHLDREVDEVTGGTQLYPSTLGRKLAPKLGYFFSDVIHVQRLANKFVWATDTMNVDLKTRHLPIAGNLEPSFAQLYAEWRKLALASAASEAKA